MPQVNKRNTKTLNEICSRLTIMTLSCLFCTKLDNHSNAFTSDFEKLIS